MEQKNIHRQALRLIKGQRQRRRWMHVMTAMAAIVVFVTTYLLILPAITMEHGTIQVEALYQKTELRTPIISTIYAAATNDSPETFFVLNADGDNAGLDEWALSFDSDNIAVLKDDEGQKIELHREYQEDGSVHIWFVLNQGQITSFSLPWINGVDRYRAETIVEEIPLEPETPEVPTEPDTPEISAEPEVPESPAEPESPEAPIDPNIPGESLPPEEPDPPSENEIPDGPESSEPEFPSTPLPESENETLTDQPEPPASDPTDPELSEPPDLSDDESKLPAEDQEPLEENEAESGLREDETEIETLSSKNDTAYSLGLSSVQYKGMSGTYSAGMAAPTSLMLYDAPTVISDASRDESVGPESAIPTEKDPVPDDIEYEIVRRTEIVLDQEGDSDQVGFLTISYGSGSSLEQAKNQSSNSMRLVWEDTMTPETPDEPYGEEYFCGLEEHIHHPDTCCDDTGILFCGIKEHVHTDECLLPNELPTEEYFCGLAEHIHDPYTCYDEALTLICSLEEHLHSDECLRQEPVVYYYEDEAISVVASPEYPDALPEDVEFQVTPVTPVTDGYNYNAYMQALNGNVGEENRYNEANTRLYDIAFLTRTPEGELVECQPVEGSVSIQFSFKREQLLALSTQETGEIEVVHLPLSNEVRQATSTTAEATEISSADVQTEGIAANVSEEMVEFSLDSFSLVAFIEKEDGTIEAIDKVEPGIGYTYKDILGNALNFGLTAQEIDKIAHMDTTLAASHVKSDGGNITAGAYTGQTGSPILIGSIAGSLKIDGQKCTVYTTSEAAKSITLQNGSIFSYTTENDIRNQVTDMISHAEAVSEEMAAQRSYQVMKYGWYWNGKENVQGWYEDQNEKELDISGLPDGTYYINGDSFLKKDDVRIKKNSGQTIVFNLSENAVNIKRFSITDVDTGKSASSATSDGSIASFAQTVVFNMPNAAKVEIQSGILGILIAPKAEVSIGSTSSGWIIADKIKNPGGEWHFVYQGFKDKEPLEVSIEVQKTLDGETPDRDTKFSFQLEKWENNQWVTKSTVQNFEGVVLFRETFNNAGTYWFRISEVDSGGEYQYDSTRYVVKVEVTELQNDGSPILKASLTYYKADNVNETSDENKVEKLIFQNTTGAPPSYVLPETGGPGISLFTTSGLTLMALGGLMYLILRRRGAESS